MVGCTAELLAIFQRDEAETEVKAKKQATDAAKSKLKAQKQSTEVQAIEPDGDWRTDGHELVQVCVTRQFNNDGGEDGWVDGLVVRWAPLAWDEETGAEEQPLWHVSFFDGDSEDLDENEAVEARAAFNKRHKGKKIGVDPSEPVAADAIDVGLHVDCKDDEGRWARAVVTHASRDGSVRVHYQGYKKDDDEWLSAREVALRFSGRGPCDGLCN